MKRKGESETPTRISLLPMKKNIELPFYKISISFQFNFFSDIELNRFSLK